MNTIFEIDRGEYRISTDPARLDPVAIQAYLSRSYWAQGISLEIVQRALYNSLCFGLYHRDTQIGLARAISDYATFAYLCDVYVLEAHRGKGMGRWLIGGVMMHPQLQNLRRFSLATRNAHDFYRQFGFQPLVRPERVMEIRNDKAYQQQAIG
ncbi:MAG: GNAT family N-acetyltransferase [Gammaproteobacteria bacterium]